MKKLISTLIITTAVVSIPTQAKTDWWDVAAETLNLVGDLTANRQIA